MQIKKHSWFTFIEVVVSITIMALFSIIWISSFERFFKSSQMTWIKTRILNIIKNENDNLVAWEISSYKITFSTGSKILLVNENYFKNKQPISFESFNFVSLTGSIVTNNTSTWNWITKTYIDNIINNTYLLSWSWEKVNIDFNSINDFEKIEISSVLDSIITNKFLLYRIDYSWRDSWIIEESIINTLSWRELYSNISIENIIW